MFGAWDKLGMVHATIMETDSVAEVLVGTLAVIMRNPGVSLDYFVVRPAAAPVEASA